MLAVKHVKLSGHEEIYLSNRVSYEPPRDKQTTDFTRDDKIWIELADGSTRPIVGGTVFVMNELGKTISRYDLSASMVPFGADPIKGRMSIMSDVAVSVPEPAPVRLS